MIFMSIKIIKVGDFRYLARLLPDVPAITSEWSTPGPMGRDELIEELLKRGEHQTDIGDAFYQADPNWLTK
jgi:hypothetical protein